MKPVFWAPLVMVVMAAGCGDSLPEVDTGAAGRDAGADARGDAAGNPCVGGVDGVRCGEGLVCRGGVCVESRCGDDVIDTESGEECEDGNDVPFDGCEPGTCTYTCEESGDCANGDPCDGVEQCDLEVHVCNPGTSLKAGSPCQTSAVADGICRPGQGGTLRCVVAGCGDEAPDEGEQCDDGNDIDGDGCDNDCTFSCRKDGDCDDGLYCNGAEGCDTALHKCVPGNAPDCDDDDMCTDDVCDEDLDRCVNELIDEDGDGHAPESLIPCGDDCDDSRPDVHPDHAELCDAIDHNCNGTPDEVAPTWYVDCDGDGFSPSTDSSRAQCEEPPSETTGCGGGWTTQRPVDMSSTDCVDSEADARPGQTVYFDTAIAGVPAASDYDYNCDDTESQRYTVTTSSCGYKPPPEAPCNPNDLRCWCFKRPKECFGTCDGSGWSSATPGCGVSADYRSCDGLPTLCSTALPVRDCSLYCVGDKRCCDPLKDKLCDVDCKPGTLGCDLWCTPNTEGCAWIFARCGSTIAARTQTCR